MKNHSLVLLLLSVLLLLGFVPSVFGCLCDLDVTPVSCTVVNGIVKVASYDPSVLVRCEKYLDETCKCCYCSGSTAPDQSDDLSEGTCVVASDINECEYGFDNCEDSCVDFVGGFECGCSTGFQLQSDGFSCAVEDACLAEIDDCEQLCTGDGGDGFSCSCRSGYVLDSNYRTCSDIDECSNAPCGEPHDCINHEGDYSCACAPGYDIAGDGHSCEVSDHCAANTHDCDQVCVVTGSLTYSCDCYSGYTLNIMDGRSCDDVNECLENTDSCGNDSYCLNDIGRYTCVPCLTGYTSSSDGLACIDVDECAQSTAGCEQTCTNNQGGFVCTCEDGYEVGADGLSCADVDECAQSTAGCEQTCTNYQGGFVCGCRSGYTLDIDGTSCIEDAEACALLGCEGTCNLLNILDQFCECEAPLFLGDDGTSCLHRALNFPSASLTSLAVTYVELDYDAFNGFTMELWFLDRSEGATDPYIVNLATYAETDAISLFNPSALKLSLDATVYAYGENLQDGLSHHVAFSISRTGQILMYIDGSRLAQTHFLSESSSSGIVYASIFLAQGQGEAGGDQYPGFSFTGCVSELRIWDSARSSSDISSSMLTHVDPASSGLVVLLRFMSEFLSSINVVHFTNGAYLKSDLYPDFPHAGDWTLGLWVKTVYTSGELFVYNDGAIALRDPSAIELEIGWQARSTGVSINDGEWHSVVVTFDYGGSGATFSAVELLVDGVVTYSSTFPSGLDDSDPATEFFTVGSFDYIGFMAEVTFWTGILTSAEMSSLSLDMSNVGADKQFLRYTFSSARYVSSSVGGSGGISSPKFEDSVYVGRSMEVFTPSSGDTLTLIDKQYTIPTAVPSVVVVSTTVQQAACV